MVLFHGNSTVLWCTSDGEIHDYTMKVYQRNWHGSRGVVSSSVQLVHFTEKLRLICWGPRARNECTERSHGVVVHMHLSPGPLCIRRSLDDLSCMFSMCGGAQKYLADTLKFCTRTIVSVTLCVALIQL